MRKYNLPFIPVLMFLLLFLVPGKVLADPPAGGVCSGVTPTADSLEDCLIYIAQTSTYIILGASVVVALLLLPYIAMLMASEDPQKIQNGKDMLVAWISGFFIIAFSSSILYIIGREILFIS